MSVELAESARVCELGVKIVLTFSCSLYGYEQQHPTFIPPKCNRLSFWYIYTYIHGS